MNFLECNALTGGSYQWKNKQSIQHIKVIKKIIKVRMMHPMLGKQLIEKVLKIAY